MKLEGEYRIAAPRQRVWDALNNPVVLQACIPGCQELVLVSPSEIDTRILAQLGPVKSVFATRITLTDLQPPERYTLSGEGKGAAAGFGRGQAIVSLREEQAATVLCYTAEIKVGGKLAQIGSRLIEGAARKLTDEFFGQFAQQLGPAVATTAPLPVDATTRTSAVTFRWLKLAGVLLVLIILAMIIWRVAS
jgi:uncharacterized protein